MLDVVEEARVDAESVEVAVESDVESEFEENMEVREGRDETEKGMYAERGNPE